MDIQNLSQLLKANAYPGRGILLGRSANDQYAVAAYFIMGRSENSRNRVFVPTEDGIRTQAFDPSKMTDPSLIIYHPVRKVGRGLVVTNGDQTDTVRDGLLAGRTFASALHTRTFEPDAPNYTPRISALLRPDGSFELSILTRGQDGRCQRQFFSYDGCDPGRGYFISTYQGPGDPLPSFAGEPIPVTVPEPEQVWAALNTDNKVALYANVGGRVTLFNKNLGD